MGAINAYQSAVKFVLKNVLKSLSISCAYDHLCVGSSFSFATYDHLWSFLARHGIKLKNRWGQPRVSSILTFLTLNGCYWLKKLPQPRGLCCLRGMA